MATAGETYVQAETGRRVTLIEPEEHEGQSGWRTDGLHTVWISDDQLAEFERAEAA